MITITDHQPILLKCPFCAAGGKMNVDENPDVPEQEECYYVLCDDCGTRGPVRDTPMQAAKWWNRCPVQCPEHPGAFMEPSLVTHMHDEDSEDCAVWTCAFCSRWIAEDGCVCDE